MTTAQMLTTWKFRMEDPDGDKWDSNAEPRIYELFTDAQRIGTNLLVDAKKFEHLRELEKTISIDMSLGSGNLPALYWKDLWLQDNNGDFVDVLHDPPKSRNNNTFFLREDSITAYGYVYGTKLYLRGYDSNSGSWTFAYLEHPADITVSADPVLSKHVNNLTIAISEYLGWGLDRQYDRQKEVDATILRIFGVTVNNNEGQ